MDSIASEIALIVCRQCERIDNETDLDFSTRLLFVYNTCYDNVENLNEQARQPILDQSTKDFLNGL